MDPLDGGAVFAALGRMVDAGLSALGERRWRCRRAVPRIDGSVYMDLTADEAATARLDWIGPGPRGASNGQVLQVRGDLAGKDAQRIEEMVNRLLGVLLVGQEFRLLGFYNRTLESLFFDDRVVDILLADRFGPGKTRWYDYRFSEAYQETASAFHLTFEGSESPMVFQVSAAAPGTGSDEALLSNRIFQLTLLQDPRTPEQRSHLNSQVERFLGFLLSRAIHPELQLESPARPRITSSRRGPDGGGPDSKVLNEPVGFDGAPISTTRWGNPMQWYQFFSDFEIERSGLCSVRFSDPACFIVHGEMECSTMEPETLTPRVDFANLPWAELRSGSGDGSCGLFTGLVEADAVMGGTGKLEQALDQAIAMDHIRLVCLNNTCLPKVIGDDVASLVRRKQKQSRIPILSMNTDLSSPEAAYADLVRQARESLDGDDPAEANDGLNLIGFPAVRGRAELKRQLLEMGVPINVFLLPAIGVGDLRRYLQGRAGLVYPHRPWLDLCDQVLADLDVPFEAIPAPYGLERTRAWFEAASRAVSKSGNLGGWLERRYEPTVKRWQELTAQASEHRLAFVVDQMHLMRLVEGPLHYGFEMLPLLEEMGFAVSVLVRVPSADRVPESDDLTAALKRPDRMELVGFSDPDDLATALAESQFDAVYSEVFFDRRIGRAGKAQFHLGMIELGLEGAIRSLERLLGICRWPFHRRYGRFLQQGGEDR